MTSPPDIAVKTSVRLATKKDWSRIMEIVTEAFIHDPVYNYFADLRELIPTDIDTQEKKNLSGWARFLLRSCLAAGGRVMVVVEQQESPPQEVDKVPSLKGSERVVGAAYWLPPNKRLALWKVKLLVDAGLVGMLRRWGLTGLLRCGFEYLDNSHKAMQKGYRKKGIKKDPDASWYLQQIAIAPECQGKGYMSMLMHEAFANAPNAIYTLEATTSKSRDQYVHLGFELVETMTFGKGKSNNQGLVAKGESAVGVECYAMVRVG